MRDSRRRAFIAQDLISLKIVLPFNKRFMHVRRVVFLDIVNDALKEIYSLMLLTKHN